LEAAILIPSVAAGQMEEGKDRFSDDVKARDETIVQTSSTNRIMAT